MPSYLLFRPFTLAGLLLSEVKDVVRARNALRHVIACPCTWERAIVPSEGPAPSWSSTYFFGITPSPPSLLFSAFTLPVISPFPSLLPVLSDFRLLFLLPLPPPPSLPPPELELNWIYWDMPNARRRHANDTQRARPDTLTPSKARDLVARIRAPRRTSG